MFRLFSLALIFLFGNYFWHLLSYYSGLNIQIASFGLTVAIAIIGIILFIASFVKSESKSTSLYLISIACAFFASYAKNNMIERFSSDCYQDGYLLFDEYEKDSWPNISGLVDKYGKVFILPRYGTILKVFDQKRKKDVFLGIRTFRYKEAEADSIIQARGGNTENISDKQQVCSLCVTTFSLDGERLGCKTIKTMDCKNFEEYIFKHIGDILVKYTDKLFIMHDEKMFFCIRKVSNSDNNEYAEDETTEKTFSSEEPSQEENLERNKPDNNANQIQNVSPEYETRDVWVDCMNCNGSGKCPSCHGEGYCVSTWSNGSFNDIYECPICHKSGKCQMCYGTRGRYDRQIFKVH